jgi:hypothetical protein
VPGIGIQLDLAESLHREATPYTFALRGERLHTVAPSAELITQDVASAVLPASYVWAKEPGLPVIDGGHWLPADCCPSEEFINLAYGRRIGNLRRHIPSGYDWLGAVEFALIFMTQ